MDKVLERYYLTGQVMSVTQPFDFALGRELVERPFGSAQGCELVEQQIGLLTTPSRFPL
jgi:hypothetical protein